jgi:hypothetical protein
MKQQGPSTLVEHLVRSGKAEAPKGSLSEVLPPTGRISRLLSEALEEQRTERL